MADFDKLCLKHKVYKLYTIGDCYVVISLMDAKNRDVQDEAINVTEMGFSMIQVLKTVKILLGIEDLDMRIGIHTGSIIGGVNGTDLVRYDIYGPDVVIANKMESNGEPGKILMSMSTKIILSDACQGAYQFTRKTEDVVIKSVT